ncbi:MAG: alpha/beta hydrolase [Rhizobiaceae bacterium]
MVLRWLIRIVVALAVLAAVAFAAFKLSPWPSVLVIRHTFDADSAIRNAALAKFKPAGVTKFADLFYGSGTFDVFVPESPGPHPVVFWIHGGAFIAGQKEDIAPYLEILASKGFVTVGIGYTTAPSAQYPGPVRQVNEAIAHILANSGEYRIDPSRAFLAGDSAGGQLAAQIAAIATGPAYAAAVGIKPALNPQQLRGVLLNCGIYDPSKINMAGAFGGFIRTVLWSYFGESDPAKIEKFDEFNVSRHLTPAFPPAFATVGNGDPLAPQTVLMANAIRAQGVSVDELYFADDYKPALPHEYQFNLETEAAQTALTRIVAFLQARSL